MATPHNPRSSDNHQAPLISEFASDADMAELIEFFLTELDSGTEKLRNAWQEGDTELLRKMAHQLKGAAGGYGFPIITKTAAELETLLTAGMSETSAVAEQVESLISLCQRAIRGA